MADIQFRLSAGMSLEMPSGHIMTQVIFGAGTSKGEFPCRTIEVTDKPWRGELEETIKQSREMATGAMFAKYPDVAHQATVERLAKIRGEKKK